MNLERERELFDQWVLKHPDNLDITKYEENIMFDAWLASANRQGYKLVPAACKHESDGLAYTSIPVKYKCKICGDFYTKP